MREKRVTIINREQHIDMDTKSQVLLLAGGAYLNFEEITGRNIAKRLIEPVNPTREKQINCLR